MKTQKTEIKVTGHMTTRFTKMDKKYIQTCKIPTGSDFFCQVTLWVPDTPGYNKAPLICLTLNNFKDKIQILFPSALDLKEFTDVFNKLVESELKAINEAHTAAVKDFTELHEILLQHADNKAKKAAETEYKNQKNIENETNL